ncbi:MAG TPA: hypothetical protein VFG68_14205 [Fimbriiglobus sp.]|nr:hypothetical protein [Fimbriiglobus sp.]
MNPPDPSGPDGRLPRLAGFADGELDDQTRKQVAEWVEADPTAAELLRDQEQLTPANTEFWAAVAPPQPDEATWEAVRRAVADRLTPAEVDTPAPTWGDRAWFAAAAGVALAVLAAWLAFGRLGPPDKATEPPVVQSTPTPREAGDPLAEFAVLELAGPDDVLIEAVSGDVPAGGYAADSPACDPMPLAGPDDVTLVGVRPGPRDLRPSCGLCPKPGDAPMIYAAGPRTR